MKTLPKRKAVTLTCGESRTIQKPSDITDINEIVRRSQKTGYLVDPTRVTTRQPMFGDFSTGDQFEHAQYAIARVHNEFLELPSAVREQFGNDPSKLLDAMSDPENHEALRELGVMPPAEPEPEPIPEVIQKVQVVDVEPVEETPSAE